MFINLLVKGLAEDYGILSDRPSCGHVFGFMKRKLDPIKKMKPGLINGKSATRLVICPEEDSGSKHSLKSFHNPVISLSVFEEVEEIEDFGGGAESDDAAALAGGHGGHPDGNEPILAVREAVLRMSDDLEEEFSVASDVR